MPDPLPEPMLFNLAEDLPETRNLAAENPRKLQELVGRWKQLNAEMAAPTRW